MQGLMNTHYKCVCTFSRTCLRIQLYAFMHSAECVYACNRMHLRSPNECVPCASEHVCPTTKLARHVQYSTFVYPLCLVWRPNLCILSSLCCAGLLNLRFDNSHSSYMVYIKDSLTHRPSSPTAPPSSQGWASSVLLLCLVNSFVYLCIMGGWGNFLSFFLCFSIMPGMLYTIISCVSAFLGPCQGSGQDPGLGQFPSLACAYIYGCGYKRIHTSNCKRHLKASVFAFVNMFARTCSLMLGEANAFMERGERVQWWRQTRL